MKGGIAVFDVPDPGWKCDPDLVADESAAERYHWGEPGGLCLRKKRSPVCAGGRAAAGGKAQRTMER